MVFDQFVMIFGVCLSRHTKMPPAGTGEGHRCRAWSVTDNAVVGGLRPCGGWGACAGGGPALSGLGNSEPTTRHLPRRSSRASGRAVGRDVILDVTADVPHVFQAFTGVLDEADHALDRSVLHIHTRLEYERTASGMKIAATVAHPRSAHPT